MCVRTDVSVTDAAYGQPTNRLHLTELPKFLLHLLTLGSFGE